MVASKNWANFFLLLGLSALPRLVIPFLSITEALPQFAFHYASKPRNFYHRLTLGPTAFHLPRPGNYYSRHRGCFRVSFHPLPTLYTCNAERVEKLERNWREEEEKVSGGKCLRNLTFTTRLVISIRASATECNQPLFVSPLLFLFSFLSTPSLVLSITPGIKLVSSNL